MRNAAGIVADQDIDLPELRFGLCDQLADLYGVGNVRGHEQGLPARGFDLRDHGVRVPLVPDSIDDDLGTVRGQDPGDTCTRTARRAGNQRHLFREQHPQ